MPISPHDFGIDKKEIKKDWGEEKSCERGRGLMSMWEGNSMGRNKGNMILT